MCVQSLTLWADAAHARREERRRSRRAHASAPAVTAPAPTAVICGDLETVAAGQVGKISTDHGSAQLVGAGTAQTARR
jgi:hypothetical protein